MSLTQTAARFGPLGPKLVTLLHESWKYFLVSAVSLALDMAIYWVLFEAAKIPYLVANVVSVSAGLVLNYALSVAWVFKERRLSSRWAEFTGFVVIGFAGLTVNEALLAAFVGGLHVGPLVGKVGAAGGSFVFNFVVRRVMLFTARG
jgi:putative flippase GtrA